MKFYKEHQEDIYLAFNRQEFKRDDFHFIKRKGRIITKHRHSDSIFSYFLKTAVEINQETGEFVDASYYEVKVNNGHVYHVPTWNQVMIELDKWMKQLPSSH